MRNIATKNTLLGYSVELVSDESRSGNQQGLYFLRKNELIKMIAAEKPASSRRGAKQWRKDK
jgi:hypothetical protein